MIINIATDFSETPGGRFKKEGPYSGEEFRERLLEPTYKQCVGSEDKLTIVFDGTYGYATSFLEEAFGGLARKLKDRCILSNIELISQEDRSIPELIKEYVQKTTMG